jgi:hypothetical protein
MDYKLTAKGAFKPRSGSWLPTTNGWRYYTHHQSFIKYRTYSAGLYGDANDWYLVGGGSAGMRPNDEADVLFWWQSSQSSSFANRCTICDPNVAWLYVTLRYPTSLTDYNIGNGPCIGKLIFSVCMDGDFSEGFFVSLEAIPMQIAVDELTYRDFGNSPRTVYPYKEWQNTRRHGYSTPRKYVLTDSQQAISEPTSYITTKWPGTNEMSIPVRDFGYSISDASAGGTLGYEHLSKLAGNTLGRIYDGYTWFYTGQYQNVYAEKQWNTGQQVLTFVNYEIECGTILSGTRSTLSKRLIWQPIDDGSYSQQMWLGVGEQFARAGIGREIFLPKMPIDHPRASSRWEKARKHWKVESQNTGGASVQILDNLYSTSETAGLSASGADAMHAVSMNATESHKSMSRRSTLAASHEDLIWKHGVIHGIDADHTRKALVSPKTIWPMEQPQQAVALAVGGAASEAKTLTVTFETATTLPDPWYETSQSVLEWCRDRIARPIAYAGNADAMQDETGRVGNAYSGIYDGSNVTTYRSVPQNAPFQGVFDYTVQFFDNGGIPENSLYWFGASDQSVTWSTTTVDYFWLNVQSLRPEKHPQICLDGTYTLTNSMPYGGGQSAEGAFSCTIENAGDEVQGWPQLELPHFIFSTRSPNSNLSSGFDILSAVNFVANIRPIAYAGKQVGKVTGGLGAFGGLAQYVFDGSYSATYGKWLNWETTLYEVSNTETKLKTTVECSNSAKLDRCFQPFYASSNWEPPDETSGDQYPKIEQLDDVIARKCQRYKCRAVKSVKWIPKMTQVFATFVRQPNYNSTQEYDFYGGQKPDSEKLTMIEKYAPAVRYGPIGTRGGRILVTIRKSWLCECVVASGSPTYSGAEVISENTVKYSAPGAYGITLGARYVGTRKVRYSVEWDIESAQTKTHTFAHEQCVDYAFNVTEAQFVALEEGNEITITGQVERPLGGDRSDEDLGIYGIPGYKSDTTTVRIRLS